MSKKRNLGGQPPKYKTPKELQEKVENYFKNEVPIKQLVVNGKKVVNIPMPTITGLVLSLGFCDRQSFYDMEKRKGFSYTIRRIRSFIAQHYEEQVLSNPQGAIFALKNFGWTDKYEVDHGISESYFEKYKDLTKDDLENKFDALCGRN